MSQFSLKMICLSVILSCLSMVNCNVEIPELNPEMYDKIITKSKDPILVMFYAPWCPHCESAKPEIFKAAAKMKQINSEMIFGLMNCDDSKNSDVCTKLKIEGYPTVRFYDAERNVHEYESDVNVPNIISFLKNPQTYSEGSTVNLPYQVKLNHTLYLTVEDFHTKIGKWRHVLVFFYAKWCEHCQKDKHDLDAASKKLNKKKEARIFAVNCDNSKSKELCEKEMVETFPSIRYYQKGEFFAEFEDDRNIDGYLNYLKKPPTTKISKENVKQKEEDIFMKLMPSVRLLSSPEIFDQERRMLSASQHLLVMFVLSSSVQCQKAAPVFELVANQVASRELGNSHFLAALNCGTDDGAKVCGEEKVENYPTVVHYSNGVRVAVFKEDILNAEMIEKFFFRESKEEL